MACINFFRPSSMSLKTVPTQTVTVRVGCCFRNERLSPSCSGNALIVEAFLKPTTDDSEFNGKAIDLKGLHDPENKYNKENVNNG